MVNGIASNRIGLGLALMALSHADLVRADDQELLATRRGGDSSPEIVPEQVSAPRKAKVTIEPTAFDLAAVSAAAEKRARKAAKRAVLAKTEA